MLNQPPPQQFSKIIRFFKVEGKEKIKEELIKIQQKIKEFIDWDVIQPALLTQKYFLYYPNQSIYLSGIRIQKSYNNKYIFQYVLKMKPPEQVGSDCVSYDYNRSNFYTNPIQIFKKKGYSVKKRQEENVISFKSFKFGFEVNIYNLSMENYKDGNKDSNEGMEENKRQLKKVHIQIIETSSSTQITEENLLWRELYEILKHNIVIVKTKNIEVGEMTIKKEIFDNWVEQSVV